jgi:hypothetical protein
VGKKGEESVRKKEEAILLSKCFIDSEILLL